jgi:hypothetical protein
MDSSKKLDPNQRPSLSEGITTPQTPTITNSLTGEASSVEPNTTNATATKLQSTLHEDVNAIHEMAAWVGRVREECVALKPFLNGLTQLCKTVDEMVPGANPLSPDDQRDHTISDNTPSQHEPSANLKRPLRPDPVGSPPRNTKRPKRAPTHTSISSGSESDSLHEITYRKTISADLRGPHRNPLHTRSPPSLSLAVRGIERPDRAVVTLHTSKPQCIGRGSPALPDMVLNLWVDEWFTESTGDLNDSHDVFSQFLRDRLPHTQHPDEPARDFVSDDDSGFIHDQSGDYGSDDSFVYDNELDDYNYVEQSESPHPEEDESVPRHISISPPPNNHPVFQEHWGDRIRTQEYFDTPSVSVTPGTTTTLPNTTIAPSSLVLDSVRSPGPPAAQATSRAATTHIAHVALSNMSNTTKLTNLASIAPVTQQVRDNLDTQGISESPKESRFTDIAQQSPIATKKNGGRALNRPIRDMTFMVYVPDEANPTATGRYEDISVLAELGANLKSDFLATCIKDEACKKRYARMTDPAAATLIIQANKCVLNHVLSKGASSNKYKNGPFRACHSCQFNNTRLCVRLHRPDDADETVFVVFPKRTSGAMWMDRGFWLGS